MANNKNSKKVKKSDNPREDGEHIEHIQQIRDLLDSLKEKDVYSNAIGGFSEDKVAIKGFFDLTSGYKKADVLLRLTVIDSMYSTQMNRRYYALEELAEKLAYFNNTKELFEKFILKRDISLFEGKIGQTKFNLWSEKYGIGKNGKDKGVAVSLISKYAYFETDYSFPIFDSIACEMYPRMWKYCGWKGKSPKLRVLDKDQHMLGKETILSYANAIDEMIKRLGGNISYEHLDRLLWFTGKIFRGNLSLVIPRDNYEWCVKEKLIIDGIFDVSQVEISKLQFCKSNSRLKVMFKLAKTLKTK